MIYQNLTLELQKTLRIFIRIAFTWIQLWFRLIKYLEKNV